MVEKCIYIDKKSYIWNLKFSRKWGYVGGSGNIGVYEIYRLAWDSYGFGFYILFAGLLG